MVAASLTHLDSESIRHPVPNLSPFKIQTQLNHFAFLKQPEFIFVKLVEEKEPLAFVWSQLSVTICTLF